MRPQITQIRASFDSRCWLGWLVHPSISGANRNLGRGSNRGQRSVTHIRMRGQRRPRLAQESEIFEDEENVMDDRTTIQLPETATGFAPRTLRRSCT